MVEIIAELPVLDDQNWWTVNGIGSSFWSSGFFASKNLGSNRFCSAKPLLARILTLTARKELRTLGLQISVHPNHNRPKCLEGQLATSIFPCNRLVSLGVAAASLFVAQQIFGYSMQDAHTEWFEWSGTMNSEPTLFPVRPEVPLLPCGTIRYPGSNQWISWFDFRTLLFLSAGKYLTWLFHWNGTFYFGGLIRIFTL